LVPGFLTQTTKFTADLLASFGFVILISLLLDIGAQLNIWRIIAVSNSRAQDVANKLLPGLGFGLACLISFGGLVFNIGNIAGCGLGMNAMAGIPCYYRRSYQLYHFPWSFLVQRSRKIDGCVYESVRDSNDWTYVIYCHHITTANGGRHYTELCGRRKLIC
jgi:hypothetical protein